MSVQFSIPLGATAAISANTAPVMGKVNRYNASSAPRSVTLPPLSGLNVGALVGIEKDTLDVSSNAVTATRAGSDTFDDATTSTSTTTPGTKLYLQVVSIASVKYWKVVDGYTPGGSTGEPAITAGTTSQYWRGDKSFQTLDKTAVGLGNVDNTSDVNKPVSTATSTALSGREPSVTAGTTSQYWRGDKTFQTLDKTAVGLANVDNVADASKPVSTAQAAADAATLASANSAATSADTTVLTTATGRAIAFAIALA